jgi:hypothetical protein
MTRREQYTKPQFIKAIPGSGGIISTIAKRIGCDWATVKRRLDLDEELMELFQSERETVLDLAESVLITNIQLAAKQQKQLGVPADTGDSKWILSRTGKHRGYSERQEITGADGDAIAIEIESYFGDDDNE